MKSVKEIQKFKIAVTSGCCLRCTHCFIDKERPERLSPEDAERGLRLFLGSPGRDKALEIYGGEPLTEFPLVKAIIAGARRMAASLGRRLSISVATNGVLASPGHLRYFARNGVRLSVSFSGGRASHDLNRLFPSGRGTYAAVRAKVPALLSALGPRMHVILCVHPSRAAAAYDDFRKLAEMGFRSIGVECVHGSPWGPGELKAFERSMRRASALVLRLIRSGVYVFPDPFLDFLRERAAGAAFCPFFRDLEMFPDGTLSLYPYPFVRGAAQRRRVSVGSGGRVVRRFAGCSPDAASPRCKACEAGYYRLPGLSGGSRAYRLRTAVFRQGLREIAVRSASEPAMRAYLKRLVTLFRRGYI